MKQLLLLFLFVQTTGFSQQVDSLSFYYSTGYKATHTIDGKEIRGVYEKKQEIRYRKKRHSYQVGSFASFESFREWDKSNLLADSLKNPGAFMRRKLPGKKLDKFLKPIITLQKNSIFSYEVKDVPKTFLKEHSLTRKSSKSQVDSLVRETFRKVSVSNVTAYFSIHFHYQGVSYDLCKDSNNENWRILINGKEEEWPVRFIHFAFDAFLLEELPKKFSGIKVLK